MFVVSREDLLTGFRSAPEFPCTLFSSLKSGGKPLVIKSGKVICGRSWNRKVVLGVGEAPKLVGLWQQKLCVGSSCVLGRAVHEAPSDVAWSLQ